MRDSVNTSSTLNDPFMALITDLTYFVNDYVNDYLAVNIVNIMLIMCDIGQL